MADNRRKIFKLMFINLNHTKSVTIILVKNCLDADVKKKYEVAKELGIYDKVLEKGWGSLTAEETGRVGGVLRKRKNSRERVLS